MERFLTKMKRPMKFGKESIPQSYSTLKFLRLQLSETKTRRQEQESPLPSSQLRARTSTSERNKQHAQVKAAVVNVMEGGRKRGGSSSHTPAGASSRCRLKQDRLLHDLENMSMQRLWRGDQYLPDSEWLEDEGTLFIPCLTNNEVCILPKNFHFREDHGR